MLTSLFFAQLARRLLEKNISKYKIGKLMDFLKFYVVLNDPYLTKSFSEEINKLTLKTYTKMGMDEAVIYITREEAKEEQNTLFIRNLLNEGCFSLGKIACLVNAPLPFVLQVKAEMDSENQ